jgi:Ca-activated chloride channel homolog
MFAALITSAPPSAHSQSKAATDCAPQHRKELVVTVVDPNASIIDSLRAEHFALKVGNTNATISDVTFHINKQPLDVMLLIDASVSQEKVLPLAKAGAKAFIGYLARGGPNRVAVVSFSNKPDYNPILTSDFATATAAIDQIKIDAPPGYIGAGVVVSTAPPGNRVITGSTSLWDVIQSTSQALFGAKPENRRRAMLLFSDGNDTSSSSKLNSVIDDLIKHDVAVFSIGLADANFDANEGNLKKLSEHTGGIARFPKNKETVETTLDAIAQQLRANYVIGYCGEVSGQGKIRVEITQPDIQKIKPVLAYKRF